MSFSAAKSKETMSRALSKWGKKVGSNIARGAKVMAKGGRSKIFRQTFTASEGEQLWQAYGCSLYTSAGPISGVLYSSSVKIAFCSDRQVSYKIRNETRWMYYKVVVPLEKLREIKPSSSSVSNSNSNSNNNGVDVTHEKYVLMVSVDDHELWFSGFVNYDKAVQNLRRSLDRWLASVTN